MTTERLSPIQPLGDVHPRPTPNPGYNTFAEQIREIVHDWFPDGKVPHGAWSGIAFEIGCSPGWVATVAQQEGVELYVWRRKEDTP